MKTRRKLRHSEACFIDVYTDEKARTMDKFVVELLHEMDDGTMGVDFFCTDGNFGPEGINNKITELEFKAMKPYLKEVILVPIPIINYFLNLK